MTAQGELIKGVKQVARDHWAWPGGYPLMTIMQDGECLCAACTQDHLSLIVSAIVQKHDPQWEAIGMDVNWEDEHILCAHCNEPIACAYPTT